MRRPKSRTERDVVVRAVEACVQKHVQEGERLLVAVSGGADSLALVLALEQVAARTPLELVIGVVDHGLRAGSADEASRVVRWAKERGLPALQARVEVGQEGGLEAAARAVRYAALERLAGETQATWICTGHTASDQAETVLLRIARGAGARGARGVLERRGRILRPLLGVTRAEVTRFLERMGQAPLVEDPSNLDLSRARNRVRHRVLPELRLALGQGADRVLARYAALARDDEAALEGWAARTPNDRAALRALPAAVSRRWLRRLCASCGLAPSAAELGALHAALMKQGPVALELRRKWTVAFGLGAVTLSPKRTAPQRVAPVEVALGRTALPWAGVALELRRHTKEAAPGALILPADVALPLVARPVRPGDRLAGERGTVCIKRLLIDRKVPRDERQRVVVLLDATGQVLWVVGHRVAAPLHAARASRGGWVVEPSALPVAEASERASRRAVKKPSGSR